MNIHPIYTDYEIIYKEKGFDRLEHITDFNRTIEIEYYKSGVIQSEKWYLNIDYHRENGPAIIFYNEFGKITTEFWCLNDKCHREDGPAYIQYDKFGKIIYTQFHLNDIEYTYEDFIKTPEYQANLKLKSINIFD